MGAVGMSMNTLLRMQPASDAQAMRQRSSDIHVEPFGGTAAG